MKKPTKKQVAEYLRHEAHCMRMGMKDGFPEFYELAANWIDKINKPTTAG